MRALGRGTLSKGDACTAGVMVQRRFTCAVHSCLRRDGTRGASPEMTRPWRCLAAPQAVIPDALQREAMTCVGEAMQVCPDVWTAEDHGLACMTGKRLSFSPRCRVIYDKVAHVLRIR